MEQQHLKPKQNFNLININSLSCELANIPCDKISFQIYSPYLDLELLCGASTKHISDFITNPLE
jgi:hypothetical protein